MSCIEQAIQAEWLSTHLNGGEDRVCLADNAYNDGTLLDSFLCVLDLEDATLW